MPCGVRENGEPWVIKLEYKNCYSKNSREKKNLFGLVKKMGFLFFLSRVINLDCQL